MKAVSEPSGGSEGEPPELLEFCLLGQFVVRRGGRAVTVTVGKQRVVLAALLLRAGQVVSLDELADAVWGDAPPASARVTLQNYVKRLRAALGDTGHSRLTTLPQGYLINVRDDELDVTQFDALQRAASWAAQRGQWDQAAERLRSALSLWRGEPLSDVQSELLLMRDKPRLDEMYLQAVEARIEADLHLGRHRPVIAELGQLTMAHALRERLYEMLMLALYRDGRQAEALGAYQRARQLVVGELGVEPGPGLRHLHQRILAADPLLARLPQPAAGRRTAPHPPAAPPGDARLPRVPQRQLPAAVSNFVGRKTELATLSGWLDAARRDGAVLISTVWGTAGVGKTALAVHWAHQVADRFPDGQLYVNLRGYDPDQPVPATDALAGFLRALGVAGQDIPADSSERAARYRTLLAGRRVLVVLDNAREVEQVRPLLPGRPGCAVVMTSRDSLAGLVAREDAQRLELDVLPAGDAVGLLRALIGGRVDAEPGAAATLAARCSWLPLVLRVAAELSAASPDVTLAQLAAELADERRRLDLLEAGADTSTGVRAVFS